MEFLNSELINTATILGGGTAGLVCAALGAKIGSAIAEINPDITDTGRTATTVVSSVVTGLLGFLGGVNLVAYLG